LLGFWPHGSYLIASSLILATFGLAFVDFCQDFIARESDGDDRHYGGQPTAMMVIGFQEVSDLFCLLPYQALAAI
jgi:hypothetical protein